MRKIILSEKKMTKLFKSVAILLILTALLTFSGCKKADISSSFEKENAGGTGYGAGVKSELYIEDFYFLTIGTEKSKVELLTGDAHYYKDNNTLTPVYVLNNGDIIALTYDEKNSTTVKATYTNAEDQSNESFFDILVSLGVLKSAGQESDTPITVVPGTEVEDTTPPETDDKPVTDTPSNDTPVTEKPPVSTPIQGEHFASGMYNLTIIEPVLTPDISRSSVVTTIGKPSYYFSHSFSEDSYIIDCYNLNDGSKLMLDYGYERLRLRCAAVYKNGSYTSILGTPWTVQTKPSGFTRTTISRNALNKLSKNTTPAKVYSAIGEPSWYEGTRGSYNDVFMLTDGARAILNFGSAHNKLTSITIKETNGKITVVTLY